MSERLQPSFGAALVAVLAGGTVSSWFSAVFAGLAPYLSADAWWLLSVIVGAVVIKLSLRILGYDTWLGSGAAALLAGRLVGEWVIHFAPGASGPALPILPAFGVFGGLPSLVVAAFLIHLTATRSRAAVL
jgi:hypothetical protein